MIEIFAEYDLEDKKAATREYRVKKRKVFARKRLKTTES